MAKKVKAEFVIEDVFNGRRAIFNFTGTESEVITFQNAKIAELSESWNLNVVENHNTKFSPVFSNWIDWATKNHCYGTVSIN